MKKRVDTIVSILLVVMACLIASGWMPALAQQSKETDTSLDQARQYSAAFERGSRVSVDNRTTGRIKVVGWDRDFIEATATSERGSEVVNVNVVDDPTGKRIFLKADYADSEDLEARHRRLEERRKSLEGRLQALDLRREALKARLTAVESIQDQTEREKRRAEVAASLQELELRRKEVADLLAGLAGQDEPKPSPTPKVESNPQVKPVPPDSATKPPLIYQRTPSTMTLRTPPTIISPPPPLSGGRPVEVNLEVKVPRSAEIELIRVSRSEVEVTGIETPLVIRGDKSTIKLSQVGAVEVKTSSGNVEIEGAAGLVDVVTASGAIRVRDAGDVRALSIGGQIEIQCARGQVDVSTTDGAVKLTGIGGDVDATTTSSDVSFAGIIRDDGRYHLKSMSGAVEMNLAESPTGFTAALSSYKGVVSTDFSLKLKQSPQNDVTDVTGAKYASKNKSKIKEKQDGTDGDALATFNHRVVGSYGSGRAQIVLDTFDGRVKLGKLAPGELKECSK